ncbi:Xylose operon regulatory protein [Pontiella desulfatans]|uniref:Xylose operon regulatory protein n=1 Tax=Pontiella desulfatans TaxID=2750659 RepID=A0A6C2U761_PONDE|nr:AraC family transcriptional regulator [Pontiella desulfatans]VGO15361.1 Xylose operon regulatory protein [Pontiella desulfatans]
MVGEFHFKNMVPPEEVLPKGSSESKCLVEDVGNWFSKYTGESIVFGFPRRRDKDGRCILQPKPHPKCMADSCPSGKECQDYWSNQFGATKGSHAIAQWQCPGGNTVFLGCICIGTQLLGFGKVVLRTPHEPMHTSLIKSAVHGTLREMELAIENSILKQKLKTKGSSPPENHQSDEGIPANEHPCVNHAIEYIAEHYRDHDLSLTTVADAIGISSCYLSSLFREATGETFHEQVRNLRLATARELMEDTNLSLSEIARRSGFSTPRNLRRAIQQTEEHE